MGRSLLLIVGAAAVFGTLSLMGGAGTSASRSVEQVSTHGERVIAREIALSGHSATITTIRDLIIDSGSFSGSQQFEGSYQGGTYQSHAETAGDTLTIVTRAFRPQTSYVVRGTYLLAGAGSDDFGDVPDFMAFAVMVENDFNITGNSRIFGAPGQNANIHTNGSIDVGGNSMVQGFGSYVTGVSTGADQHFHPLDNPDERATVSPGARVDLPDFNASDYIDMATTVTVGDLNLETTTLGTPDYPTIWHVTGDLTAHGGNLSGYGIFVVEGDIHFNGNLTSSGGENGESSVAFYTSGSVTLNGTATVYAQIYAEGDVTLNGTATLYGSMTTKNNARLNGNFNIHYRNASPALTAPIWPSENPGAMDAITRINHREGG